MSKSLSRDGSLVNFKLESRGNKLNVVDRDSCVVGFIRNSAWETGKLASHAGKLWVNGIQTNESARSATAYTRLISHTGRAPDYTAFYRPERYRIKTIPFCDLRYILMSGPLGEMWDTPSPSKPLLRLLISGKLGKQILVDILYLIVNLSHLAGR